MRIARTIAAIASLALFLLPSFPNLTGTRAGTGHVNYPGYELLTVDIDTQGTVRHSFDNMRTEQLPAAVRRFLRDLDKPLDELIPSVPEWIKLPGERRSNGLGLSYHEKTYSFEAPLAQVWELYTQVPLLEAWTTPSSTFGLIYDRDDNRVYYDDSDDIPCLAEDAIFVMQLSIANLMRIPVAFEITRVDTLEKQIEFTYLSDNVSAGRQILSFMPNGDGSSIRHSTYFSSGKSWRDSWLYPHFHEVVIDDFHEGMIKRMEQGL